MKTDFKYKWGASLSQKECRAWGINPFDALSLAIDELNIHQFRMMSYWDEIEKDPGEYSFKQLDRMIDLAYKKQATVSLCLGLRQPRWPEVHEPDWAKKLRKEDYSAWQIKLNEFIVAVVNRYKNHPAIDSWQLENEALNRGFGVDGDFNRRRLRNQLSLVKMLDQKHPVIMSTSNSFALPIRRPRPDMFGFSWYTVQFKKGKCRNSVFGPLHYILRGWAIKLTTGRPVFIHELQCEPWGPKANFEMSVDEMNQSMSPTKLKFNINQAKKSHLQPYYMWGLEWWYAMKLKGESQWWYVVKRETT